LLDLLPILKFNKEEEKRRGREIYTMPHSLVVKVGVPAAPKVNGMPVESVSVDWNV
jgi:hypothetical protein